MRRGVTKKHLKLQTLKPYVTPRFHYFPLFHSNPNIKPYNPTIVVSILFSIIPLKPQCNPNIKPYSMGTGKADWRHQLGGVAGWLFKGGVPLQDEPKLVQKIIFSMF